MGSSRHRGAPYRRPDPWLISRTWRASDALRPGWASAAEAADHVVEDRQAEREGIERHALVDPVEPLEEALVGLEAERREAERRDVAQRGDEDVPQRTLGRDLDRLAPDDELDRAGGQQLGPDPPLDLGPDIGLGRARQDATVDLDDGVAGDDVVLDAGLDDVRAEGVA